MEFAAAGVVRQFEEKRKWRGGQENDWHDRMHADSRVEMYKPACGWFWENWRRKHLLIFDVIRPLMWVRVHCQLKGMVVGTHCRRKHGHRFQQQHHSVFDALHYFIHFCSFCDIQSDIFKLHLYTTCLLFLFYMLRAAWGYVVMLVQWQKRFWF